MFIYFHFFSFLNLPCAFESWVIGIFIPVSLSHSHSSQRKFGFPFSNSFQNASAYICVLPVSKSSNFIFRMQKNRKCFGRYKKHIVHRLLLQIVREWSSVCRWKRWNYFLIKDVKGIKILPPKKKNSSRKLQDLNFWLYNIIKNTLSHCQLLEKVLRKFPVTKHCFT